MNKFLTVTALASVLALPVAAFAQGGAATGAAQEKKMMKSEMSGEKTVMVGGAAMFPSKNIIENAVNSKDHTTLVAAVKAAGLVETLQGKGPFTVFAPTSCLRQVASWHGRYPGEAREQGNPHQNSDLSRRARQPQGFRLNRRQEAQDRRR